MSIQKISTDQLRRMGDQEGLILQGCGGDPQEWVDGINEILTENSFPTVTAFDHTAPYMMRCIWCSTTQI